jgi:regulator of sirC expression with transglutaminase-like and TPR domain
MASDPHQEFRDAVDRPDEALDLARAALAIARTDYHDLNIAGYISRLDRLSAQVLRRLGPGPVHNVQQSIAALNHVLFEEEGYRGNRDDYFDPKNSFLNEVIDRKRGIPITLSVLYIEVARRIGVELQGVGFPGHFLVKYADGREEIIIDPFNRGEIRSLNEVKRLLQELYGGRIAFHPGLLDGVRRKQILRRILNNLKGIYLRDQDLLKALSVLQRLLILDPNSAEDLRDRGAVYLGLECFNQALEDLEGYLRLSPEAEDVVEVRERVIELRKQVTKIQ